MSQTPENRVTAADVRNVKFQLIRRGGYDPGQVDPFLEVVAQTLEGGPYADWRINGEYIHGVRFTTVRRGGYMPAQVDAFLDRVIDTFDAAAADGHHPSASAAVPQPAAPPAEPASIMPIDQYAPVTAAPPEPVVPDPVVAAPAPQAPAPPPVPVVAAPEPAPVPPAPAAAVPDLDRTAEADFDRLRVLHESGVLSDKEFAVLGARVKRRINAQQGAVVG